ncbi:uncharacterized protein LOC128859587 [Anastrepha ludens]|uniref:uncharacterized protein LOC128859587 n=1 Tax=Anastrepha ludens TaxID=28586 RepID=UPI0023AF841C|nr:uncharacterized protein LOC128859587 [Anastrepha ludens]
MLERRPLWGLIVLLNVCVVIWRMQEPAMLNVEYDGSAAESAHQQQQHQQHQERTSWAQAIVSRNSITEQQQLYAGKHLLADSAEANEIEVTHKSDDSLHISGYSSSSSPTSRKSHKNKQQIIKQNTPSLSVSSVKSTLAPLVTAATLKNTADIQTTTTGDVRIYNFPPDDFHQLIDLHDFTYLISQNGCSRDIQALILVHSAPANEGKRRLIRETWGNTDLLPRINGVMPFRIIFLLGTVHTEAQQLDIERENFENGDMVQGSFVDSYRNMTYKHVMAFKWFLYNCAHAQILIKVDDDVYVNTPQLLISLERTLLNDDLGNGGMPTAVVTAATSMQHTAYSTDIENNSMENSSRSNSSNSNSSANVRKASDLNANTKAMTNTTDLSAAQILFHHPQDLLFCKTNINAKVKRSFRSKWRVTAKEYPGRYYPPYCPGFAIIYSPDVALTLYNAAQISKYFWIDDVLITGILAQNISITITNANQYILYESDCDNLLNDVVNSEDVEFIYAWDLISPKQMQKVWELYLAKAKIHFSRAPTSTSALSLLHAAKKLPYNPTDLNKFKTHR